MGGLDQGKDQLPHVTTDHFSDFHISDVSESDEEDTSGSEYDVNDNDTEGMINISEDVISDHGVLANRKWSVITLSDIITLLSINLPQT